MDEATGTKTGEKEAQQELQAQQQMLHQKQEADRQSQLQQYLNKESENLMNLIPEWKDPERMASDKQAIREYAKSIGYTDKELSEVYDSRAVMSLRHGMLLSQIETTGKRKLQTGVQPIRAGSPGTAPRKSTLETRARQKLAKSHSMSDAQEVFKHILNK